MRVNGPPQTLRNQMGRPNIISHHDQLDFELLLIMANHSVSIKQQLVNELSQDSLLFLCETQTSSQLLARVSVG